jgi:hypothetical protein
MSLEMSVQLLQMPTDVYTDDVQLPDAHDVYGISPLRPMEGDAIVPE